MMVVLVRDILSELVHDYGAGSFGTYQESPQLEQGGFVERVLATCVLSSNWLFSKAKIAAEHLVAEFALHSISSEIPDERALEEHLRLIAKCRYPRTKATQLNGSFKALRTLDAPLSELLVQHGGQRQLRQEITSKFPGLGLKQASMFLRDTGVAYDLAIVDVHVLWYMRHVEGWDVKTLTSGEYMRIEEHLRLQAQSFQIPLGVLDCIIWTLVRQIKEAKKSEWQTQYALPLED